MPNFAPKIDVKVGSKIVQKSAKTLVFFGQPTFLLCSGGLEPAFKVLFSAIFHLEALRLAFNDGRLVGHLGIPVIEELVGQWETDRVAVVRKLVLVHDLMGFDKILKPANTLPE